MADLKTMSYPLIISLCYCKVIIFSYYDLIMWFICRIWCKYNSFSIMTLCQYTIYNIYTLSRYAAAPALTLRVAARLLLSPPLPTSTATALPRHPPSTATAPPRPRPSTAMGHQPPLRSNSTTDSHNIKQVSGFKGHLVDLTTPPKTF